MREMDAWCNYGFRLLDEMGEKHPDRLAVLKRLKVLTDRRVADLEIRPLFPERRARP